MNNSKLFWDAKVFLFDWDNTLVESWGTIAHCLNHVFALHGKRIWSLDEVKLNSRHSLRHNFPILFGDQWEIAREQYYKEFKRIHLQRLSPYLESEKLLSLIKAHNIPMALISNKTQEHLETEVITLKWDHFFEFIYGAGIASKDKPDAEVGEMALKRLGILDKQNVYYVGDTNLDIEFAFNLGVKGILIGDRIEIGTPPRQAHHYFESIHDLIKVL